MSGTVAPPKKNRKEEVDKLTADPPRSFDFYFDKYKAERERKNDAGSQAQVHGHGQETATSSQTGQVKRKNSRVSLVNACLFNC